MHFLCLRSFDNCKCVNERCLKFIFIHTNTHTHRSNGSSFEVPSSRASTNNDQFRLTLWYLLFFIWIVCVFVCLIACFFSVYSFFLSTLFVLLCVSLRILTDTVQTVSFFSFSLCSSFLSSFVQKNPLFLLFFSYATCLMVGCVLECVYFMRVWPCPRRIVEAAIFKYLRQVLVSKFYILYSLTVNYMQSHPRKKKKERERKKWGSYR